MGTSDAASAKDLHAVLVDSAIARDDEMARVADSAKSVDTRAILRHALNARDGDMYVRDLVRAAAVSSVRHLGEQTRVVRTQVHEEAQALKRQDPTKVPAIKDEDIARRRSEAMIAKAEGTTS